MESIYQAPFSTYRKINYSERACFATICRLVWKVTDASEIPSLFWE
jgi:hypothetical protein